MEIKEIRSAADLRQLASDPAGSYVLMQDVDMAEQPWLPVDFSGTLDGGGHTIFHLRAERSEERKNAGFFGILSGTVRDLHLRDTYVCSSGADYAGILAGVITGTATGCTVAGQLCACAEVCAGSMAGLVSGTCHGGSAVTAVTGPENKYEAAGLCADVMMPGKAALVGRIAEGATVSGLWRDNTHRFEKLSQTLQQRRAQVVDYMRSMATIQWRADQDKLEYLWNEQGSEILHYQVFARGKTYMGIPYAHSAGGRARFLAVMAKQEGDVYTTRPGLENGRYYAGEKGARLGHEDKECYGFIQYMGNDCSSAVSWAWRQVSSVDIAEGGCYGRYSANMVPTEENKQLHGILPTGDFFAPDTDTRTTMAQMGAEPMYEAYAKALRGDGLCGYDTSGHVLLISYDPMVIRDAANTIEPHKSFFVTIEQGGGFYDSKNPDDRQFKSNRPEPLQSSWRVDYRYDFYHTANKGLYEDTINRWKYHGCDHNYLTITMDALQRDDAPAATPRVWMEGTTVHSNFYISATQLDGPPVHTQISHDWHIYREFPVSSVDLAAVHALQPGTYTARIHLSNEQTQEVTFTV